MKDRKPEDQGFGGLITMKGVYKDLRVNVGMSLGYTYQILILSLVFCNLCFKEIMAIVFAHII